MNKINQSICPLSWISADCEVFVFAHLMNTPTGVTSCSVCGYASPPFLFWVCPWRPISTSDLLTQGRCENSPWRDEGQTHYYRNGLGGVSDDWGAWRQRARSPYQGRTHCSGQKPLTWYCMVKLSPLMKGRRWEGPISTWSGKNVSGARQTTHTSRAKTNTNRKAGRPSIKAVSLHLRSGPESTWLKRYLPGSARTVSVNSESFGPDWRDGLTLVVVTGLTRRASVCVCVYT